MRCRSIIPIHVSLLIFILAIASSATKADDEFKLPETAKVGTDGYLSGELIYSLDNLPTPECHASTIVETSGGLVAAWFGGTHEKHPDVGIWVSRYQDSSWTKPVEVFDGSEHESKEYACWNPVLFQPRSGPLMLFYKVGRSPRSWWGMLATSDDHGRTWSAPARLGTNEKLGELNTSLIGPVKNKPVQLKDGTIICPSSTEHNNWRVHFEVSRDEGKSWEVIGPINDGEKFNAIQPSIVHAKNDQLQILCRTKEKVIATSESADQGQTWSPLAATKLPNPNAGTDAVTLSDGRQLLVYNHAERDYSSNGRQVLNVAIRGVDGPWKPVMTLENDPDKAGYSYPAVIQSSDGNVHITYTWQRHSIKHVVVDPKQLR